MHRVKTVSDLSPLVAPGGPNQTPLRASPRSSAVSGGHAPPRRPPSSARRAGAAQPALPGRPAAHHGRGPRAAEAVPVPREREPGPVERQGGAPPRDERAVRRGRVAQGPAGPDPHGRGHQARADGGGGSRAREEGEDGGRRRRAPPRRRRRGGGVGQLPAAVARHAGGVQRGAGAGPALAGRREQRRAGGRGGGGRRDPAGRRALDGRSSEGGGGSARVRGSGGLPEAAERLEAPPRLLARGRRRAGRLGGRRRRGRGLRRVGRVLRRGPDRRGGAGQLLGGRRGRGRSAPRLFRGRGGAGGRPAGRAPRGRPLAAALPERRLRGRGRLQREGGGGARPLGPEGRAGVRDEADRAARRAALPAREGAAGQPLPAVLHDPPPEGADGRPEGDRRGGDGGGHAQRRAGGAEGAAGGPDLGGRRKFENFERRRPWGS